MKKYFIAIIVLAFSINAIAQSTSPRFGTAKNQDFTARQLNYKIGTVTDASGNDTVTVTPNAFQTYNKLTMTDSVSIKFAPASSYYGDNYKLIVTGASGTKVVKFVGSYVTLGATGEMRLTSTKGAVITFIFDGAKWVEQSRVLQ